MTPLEAPRAKVLLYEGPGSQVLESEARFEIVRTLLEKGYPVSVIAENATAGDRNLPALTGGAIGHGESGNGVTVVLGRFSQPPAANGAGAAFREIGGLDPAAVAVLVEEAGQQAELPQPGKWKPWFPVIDYDRCTNCMQCLSFCLFDVYGVSPDGRIQVQNQSNCKTDCPACSRVCPEVAILFPKYRHGPIHGGEVNADDLRREAMKVDISALLGGDIYSMLRDRSAKAKSRFSKERDEERALKERLNCLNKLQKEMDIPGEVIAALPSVEQIRARAEAAKARADAALAQQRTEP